MTVHHADFAIPVDQPMDVSSKDGITGRVIAIGWWVEQEDEDDKDREPTGTLYLVVDPNHPRPMWVPEGDLVWTRMV